MSFTEAVRKELLSARRAHPGRQHSLHEGYAVLLEEVDEVWDEVKKKARLRNIDLLRNELVQVAAMAQRMAEDNALIDTDYHEEPAHVKRMKQELRTLRNQLNGSGDHPWIANQINSILEAYRKEGNAAGYTIHCEARPLSRD